MLLVLLLDPHWNSLEKNIPILLLYAFVLLVVVRLLLWVEGRLDRQRTHTTSRAWSTQRATMVGVTLALLLLLLNLFR